MRVTIFHAEDDREIKIILPTDLIMNPLTAAVAVSSALPVKTDTIIEITIITKCGIK